MCICIRRPRYTLMPSSIVSLLYFLRQSGQLKWELCLTRTAESSSLCYPCAALIYAYHHAQIFLCGNCESKLMSLCLCIKHLLIEPFLISTIVLIVKYIIYFSISVIYKVFPWKIISINSWWFLILVWQWYIL